MNVPLQLSLVVDGQPLADVLLPYLQRIIMDLQTIKTDLDNANTALEASNARLDAVSAQLDKGINEVIIAISNGASLDELTEHMNRLRANVAAAGAKVDAAGAHAQTLDDLNPDAPA